MAAICRFCGQEFANDQAVKAHLKTCDAYRNRPKAIALPKGNPSGSAMPLGIGGNGRPTSDSGAGDFDLIGKLEKQVAARRLRMTLREMDEAEADLDRKTEAKERERQRIAEQQADGPRRAAQEREAERVRAEQARLARERHEDARQRRRDRIQAIKQAALAKPFSKRPGMPDLSAQVLPAIERALSDLPVDELPDHELMTIARAARDRVYRKVETVLDEAETAKREAQSRDWKLAERKNRLIEQGAGFAKRELEAVDDLDALERLRIRLQIERELREITGEEPWADIEDLIDEIFEAEGIGFDDADNDG